METGTIGDVYYVESEYAHDYMMLCDTWRADPDRHGVIGGGCHAVDLLRWLAGDPVEVFAYGTHKLLPQVPVEWWDERYTSVLAHRAMLDSGIGRKARQNKALVDEISATIILQGWMEQLNRKS